MKMSNFVYRSDLTEQKLLLENIPEKFDLNRPKWSGYFKVVEPATNTMLQTDSQSIDGSSLYSNSNWYQFVTYGSAARLNRYREYDLMDGDCDITRSLDLIAEEMCGNIAKNTLPFVLDMANDSQMPKNTHYVVALTAALKKWCDIQSFSTRIFPTNRKTVKYGDCFYKKKSNIERWIPLSPKQIIGAIVDKEDVTNVVGWQVRKDIMQAHGSETIGNYQVVGSESNDADYEILSSNEVVRFGINLDLADVAPFGESILQSVYRTFRQKQLLEDAILIHRISRAPSRLVFNIDTSGMQPHRVQQYLEKVKNDMNQKIIPSPNAEGGVESTYNPACLVLNTKIPLLDGRTLELSELIDEFDEGKVNWAYSVNPDTGETAPGKITWAGVTRKQTQTVTLTFDNNETLTCTPDHKIPTRNRGFVEAKDLTNMDLLFHYDVNDTRLGKVVDTNRIISLEYYDHMHDVGTLTIDGEHELHDYHTFAIDAGIYVKNSQLENYYFAKRENGLGSTVEQIPGDAGNGSLDDLEYFENKTFRGLKIPLSYIQSKAENPAIFNDGKIGLAYMEETKFSNYIERLQADQERVYDAEFKMFVRDIGLNIDPLNFSIKLPSPTNFGIYRDLELNTELLNAFSSADSVNSLSKRYAMKKYLNWNEAEIAINEQWKRQELGLKQSDPTAFRKIYDSTSQDDTDIGGGSFRDLDSSFGGHEMDMGSEDENANDINANDTGNLNAGSGDQLGSSNADK